MSNRCNFTRKNGFSCGSFAFNLHQDQIDQGDLCDVHYWQTMCIDPAKVNERIRQLMASNAVLVAALKARLQLTADIRAMGRPPHADYWHQSIAEVDQQMIDAVANHGSQS